MASKKRPVHPIPAQDAFVLKHVVTKMANLNYAVVIDSRPGERRVCLTCTVLANAHLQADLLRWHNPAIYERVTKGWRVVPL